MLQLIPMTENDFENFIALTDDAHARDRMKTDFQSYEEALASTRNTRNKALTAGLKTPNHYFFNSTINNGSSKIVGSVWLSLNPETAESFIYYITINENERRKGYGQQTMSAIEKFAKGNGSKVLWLNVFGHNYGARKLYQGCGFNEAAIHMNKPL